MSLRFYTFALTILLTSGAAFAKEERPNFAGFYTQIGVGGAHRKPSSSFDLTINGVDTAATMSSDSSNNYWVGKLELGHSWVISPNLLIGVGVAIMPMGESQQGSKINIRGTAYPFVSGKTAYNYSLFISPMMKLGEDGVLYAKLGYQSTVIREDELPDLSGYLAGLGYKQFFYHSLYAFGEFNYYASMTQKIHRTMRLPSGATLDANVGLSPDIETLLMGIGYQF
jgi:hypothetical protein